MMSTTTAATAAACNTRSLLNLCYFDPPKYGWTACGGVASILEPHEMARRREAKEIFFIRQREQEEEARRKSENEATALPESRRSIREEDGNNDSSESPQKKKPPSSADKKFYKITESAALTSENNDDDDNNNNNSDREKSIDIKNINNLQNMMKKITIQKMNQDTGLIDIYTYHQGRVGDEARDPKTGELLCDSDPVDTNHNWVPPKMLVKITISFPLGDPDEEEYYDSDLSDDDDGGLQKNMSSKNDFTRGDSGIRNSPTRASLIRSRHIASMTEGYIPDKKEKSTSHKTELPQFVQTVDWDLGDPATPTAEEYAASIASEFGLTFPQMIDLKESIQKQLRDFTYRQPHFFAPIKILDAYGNERPNSHFGPDERHSGSVCGSASKPSIRRSASALSSSRKSGGGGSSSARGAVKPDKKGISVVPKDQIEGPNQSGNKFAEEILKRCKQSAKAKTTEMISNGQSALNIAKNEVCHICHNRKETVLCFPCGRHAYCDYHCGVGFIISFCIA